MRYLTAMSATPAATIALLPLLLLLLILGGLVYGIILWITSGKGGTKGEMACGGCGYAVRGLEALNCPECGADLRMVGINRGASGSRKTGIALTLICGGLLTLGCCGSVFFLSMADSGSSSIAVPAQASPSVLQSIPNQPTPADDTELNDVDSQGSSLTDQPALEESSP